MIGWPRLSVLGTLFGALCIWFAGLDFPVLAPWPRLSGSVLVVSASWPWFSDFEVSFRFLEFASPHLCVGLDSLALVDWLGHPVRGFSLGVLSLSLSVFCVLSWVSCGCPFGSALMVLVCRSWTSCFGLVVLGGWPFSFCFRFLGLGLVIVTPTCSGRLTVAPRSFKFRAWSWVLWSWIPDCKLTSPGSWWPALFGLECLDSGLLSWLSGWDGFASGFSGLCSQSGLAFSVACSPDSSSLVGLGFVGSWDVGGFSNLLIFVTLFKV